MKQINTYPFAQRNDISYTNHYKKLSKQEKENKGEYDKMTLLKMEESKIIGDIFNNTNNRYNF